MSVSKKDLSVLATAVGAALGGNTTSLVVAPDRERLRELLSACAALDAVKQAGNQVKIDHGTESVFFQGRRAAVRFFLSTDPQWDGKRVTTYPGGQPTYVFKETE